MKTTLRLNAMQESWPLLRPFRIANYNYAEIDVLVVKLRDGYLEGWGEAAGVDYLGETPDSMIAQVESVRAAVESGASRAGLARLLPPGGARNALDCALWDLEAQRGGESVWRLAGLRRPRPLTTTFTIGADTASAMAAQAAALPAAHALKLKLLGDAEDRDRVLQVRRARPDAWIAVDANQALTVDGFADLLPHLVQAGVALVEQPLPADLDRELVGLASPIPIAADESVQGLENLEELSDGFDAVNIKLDKCGGLSEALAMASAARRRGLGVMVGNMLGTSLAMAPAWLVGQLCDVIDLDGPALLAADRDPAVRYDDGAISCEDVNWGGGVPRAAD